MRNQHKTTLTLLLILLVSACSSAQPTDAPAPTATHIDPFVTETGALPTETPTPTNTPVPMLERAQYKLNTTIDYDLHTVSVDETILYPNLTGNQLNTLVIAIVPNLWQDSFSLTGIAIAKSDYDLAMAETVGGEVKTRNPRRRPARRFPLNVR